MTDSVPAITAWQPVAQVGRAGRTTDQKKRSDAFEEKLTEGGGGHAKPSEPPVVQPPPPDDPEGHERARGALEDGTGESLDVTA